MLNQALVICITFKHNWRWGRYQWHRKIVEYYSEHASLTEIRQNLHFSQLSVDFKFKHIP